MYKKLFSFFLILILTFSFLTFKSHAYLDVTNAYIEDFFHTWELVENNGVSMLRSNRIENKAENISLSLESNFASTRPIEILDLFVDQNGAENSRLEVFSDNVSIHLSDTYPIAYEAPEATEWLYLQDIDNSWNVYLDQGVFYEIVLVLKSGLSDVQKLNVLNVFNNHYEYRDDRAVDITVEATFKWVIIDPTVDSELELLPDTNGSIFENLSDMADVSVSINGYVMSLVITYDTVYDLEYTFSEQTDMSVFDDQNRSFYFTHDEMKYIVFNHAETSMFESDDPETFTPYTIWNLSTNEIETHYRFTTYIYSELEDANNVYAYFYVDDFVIDHLLSVSLAYRYKYQGLFEDDTWEDPVHLILEADEEVTGLDPTSWQFDFLASASVVTSVGSLIPVVRWPVLLIGTASMAYVGSTVQSDLIQTGNVSQIEEISTPTQKVTDKLNEAYTLNDPNFPGLDPDLNVYKLHLGQYNKPFTSGIAIDESYSEVNGQQGINIIQFTYRTHGQVYTIKGENIDVSFTPGPGTDETPDNGFNLWDMIVAFVKDAYEKLPIVFWIIGMFILVLVMIVLHNIWKFLKVGLKIVFSPFGFFVIIGTLIFLLISGVI
jgi:hypothetical protein